MTVGVVRLATRGSPLARVQSDYVGRRLVREGLASGYELIVVQTVGDRRLDIPISGLARQGVFTSEVENAVLDGLADVAVHSAKDLPSSRIDPGLILASTPVRADPRDVLVGSTLNQLHSGATIATGSVRRRIQLRALIPNANFVELRGNIATRLTKIPNDGAAVFAYAALERLDLASEASEVLSIETMLPQVGQGAIALRCRIGDEHFRELLAHIDDFAVHQAVRAERAFLARLGGGCDAPVGAYARCDPNTGDIELEALLGSDDGLHLVREVRCGSRPEVLGARLADELVRLLAVAGGEVAST